MLPGCQRLIREFKGSGKRGHIVADTLSPTKMFPCLPARATFVADTNFVSGHKKKFSDFVQKHFVSATNVSQFMQPKKLHGQQCVRNNVSSFTETVTPQRCIFDIPTTRHYEVIYFVFLCQNETEYGTQRKIRNVKFKNYPLWFAFSSQSRIWSFRVAVLQSMAKKCTKNYNARAQPLHCSSTLLFSDIAVAVVVPSNSKPYPWQIVEFRQLIDP